MQQQSRVTWYCFTTSHLYVRKWGKPHGSDVYRGFQICVWPSRYIELFRQVVVSPPHNFMA